jgi:hypothetical protein
MYVCICAYECMHGCVHACMTFDMRPTRTVFESLMYVCICGRGICVFMYACTHMLYIHAIMCFYVCMHAHVVHTCNNVHKHMHIYVCTYHVHMYHCVHTPMYECTHLFIYVPLQTSIYFNTCSHVAIHLSTPHT